MKRIIYTFIALLWLLAGSAAAADAPWVFPADKIRKVVVDLQCGGAIDVVAWEQKQVQAAVTYQKGHENGWNIRCTPKGDVLEVSCDAGKSNNRRTPSFSLHVPVTIDLELKTMGGGISVTGVHGSIGGRTMGGALQYRNIQGELRMKTMGGDIELRDSDVDGEVTTMGGRVLIENVIGDIKGRSMGGNVVYRNARKRGGSPGGKVVKIHTMGGDIHVDEAEDGADLETMGGAISVKSAKKFVKAKTMGGDIEIKALEGGVNATTMGGDISVRVTGEAQGQTDIRLVSMGGDITLVVPAGLAMTFEIELTYTKGNEGEYTIASDFPLQTREDAEWSREHGKPRKTIHGTGKTGDGRHKVVISTSNGNIKIKKG